MVNLDTALGSNLLVILGIRNQGCFLEKFLKFQSEVKVLERFFSDWNILDHLCRVSTYFSQKIPAKFAIPFLANWFITVTLLLFTYSRNLENE